MFTTYDLYAFVNTVYWSSMLVLILIGWGILKANKARMRFYVAWLLIVPAGFIAMILPRPKKYQAAKEQQERYEQAKAVFEKQCEKAGEKIYRTVDNVEGIMLLKIVPKSHRSADARARDPMWAEAALQQSAYDTEFIELFLENGDKKFYYKYIDVFQNTDNQKVIRYSGKKNHMYENGTPKYPARYAVNYELDVNPELRKHWVAGATIQIIDRQQNEIIAEKTWFVFETGLGGKGGGRMPWKFAVACYLPNSLAGHLGYENKMDEYFVPKILTPKQETQNVK